MITIETLAKAMAETLNGGEFRSAHFYNGDQREFWEGHAAKIIEALPKARQEGKWPREIWAEEPPEGDMQGWDYYTSVHATVGKQAEFHQYVDGDIHASQERYYETRLEEGAWMRADLVKTIKELRNWIEDEAADRGDADAAYPPERRCATILKGDTP